MPTTPTVTHWPTCTACGHPLTLTVGLPVTFSPSSRNLVSVAVDLSEAADKRQWEDAVSCECETQPERAPAEYDALAACITETAAAVTWGSAEAIVNRTDTPYLPQ